jgi:transposase
MNKKYIVRLETEEREVLKALVNKGKAAYSIKHAHILLLVDVGGPGWSDEKTAEALHCHEVTVGNVRRRFVEQGLEAALCRKQQDRSSRARILDGEAEARLLALACGPVPEGRSKWTLSLLADKLVELEVVEAVSRETVRRTLKKTNSSRICADVG